MDSMLWVANQLSKQRDEARAEVVRLRARVEWLLEVLEPFAKVECSNGTAYCPGCNMFAGPWPSCGCPYGAARAALEEDGNS